jgi:hypothetical protein
LAFINFSLTATKRMEGTAVVEMEKVAAELLIVELRKKSLSMDVWRKFSSIPCETMNLCSQAA